MCSKWLCFITATIGIICCECEPRRLSANEPPTNQEKWLFLLDQIRSHGEQLKSGECTITGRMYSPERAGKTILIDHKFDIRLAFVRPLKCRWEGRIPAWINDPKQAGVDEKGNPTGGLRFGDLSALFAANGPDGAWWDSDHGVWIIILPRSTAENHLDRTLYFPDIAYLTLYASYARNNRSRPDEILDLLKKEKNVSIDDSGPVWKANWTTPTKVKDKKLDVVTIIEADTEHGFTVTKYAFIMRWPNGEEAVQEQLTAKWEHRNGAYVPVHYTTQIGVIQGGMYTTTEADLTWSSVNTPLADSLFEWSSLEVPPGTGVLDARGPKPNFIKMVSPVSDSGPEPDRSWNGWVLAIVAAGAALMGIWLWRWYARRRTMAA